MYKMKVGWIYNSFLVLINQLYYSQVDRSGTKVTVVEQKQKKDYSFQDNILELCVQCLETGIVPEPKVPQWKQCKYLILLDQYPIDEEVMKKRKHTYEKVSVNWFWLI